MLGILVYMMHYVCIGGCGKVSDSQTKCNTPGCWRGRNPLGECKCKDGQHTAFFKMYNPQMIEKTKKEETTQN